MPGRFDRLGNRTYDARAMGSPLTEHALPEMLADRGQIFEIKEEILNFPRLAGIVEGELSHFPETALAAKWRQFPVRIKLRFGWADSRRERVTLTGDVASQLAAVCQRCLEPFEFGVQADLQLLLAKPGDQVPAASGYEIWELDNDWLRPADIVEEALIMAMPLAARHEDGKICRPIDAEAPPDGNDKVRPFADLRSQMQD